MDVLSIAVEFESMSIPRLGLGEIAELVVAVTKVNEGLEIEKLELASAVENPVGVHIGQIGAHVELHGTLESGESLVDVRLQSGFVDGRLEGTDIIEAAGRQVHLIGTLFLNIRDPLSTDGDSRVMKGGIESGTGLVFRDVRPERPAQLVARGAGSISDKEEE
jgi:hypothetical protein